MKSPISMTSYKTTTQTVLKMLDAKERNKLRKLRIHNPVGVRIVKTTQTVFSKNAWEINLDESRYTSHTRATSYHKIDSF